MYSKFFKRLIDIILSSVGIIVLAIPMIVVAVAIKLDSPGNVLFRQERVGIHKKTFTILKFRSMRSDTPKNVPTHLLNNAESHITKLGAFIRKTSIDELPQLFCIFIGTMTIIGPRPALFNQTDLLAERDKYGANDIKPGLTGLAQIRGRDELPIEVKAALDGEYAKNITFAGDVKLFFATIFSVLKSDGVVEGGTGEMARKTKEKEENILN